MNRLYLRLFEPSDYLETLKLRSDPQITNLLGGNHFFVSSEIEKNWVLSKSTSNTTDLYLAMCLLDNDCMIGYCSINNIDLRNQRAEWGGTIVFEQYWGKGYATEASRLMLSYLFQNYPIHRCYAYCLAEHSVTINLFIKMGMTYEGMLRDDLFKDGVFKNKVLYSILREEYYQSIKERGLE